MLGAVFDIPLKEYLPIRWVDVHLLVFGAPFVAIGLLVPGGLVEVATRKRRLPVVFQRRSRSGRAEYNSGVSLRRR